MTKLRRTALVATVVLSFVAGTIALLAAISWLMRRRNPLSSCSRNRRRLFAPVARYPQRFSRRAGAT
jgi:hypothetical protein